MLTLLNSSAMRVPPTSSPTKCGASNTTGRPASDRKSTRLNSSHVKISYAVSRALPSFPTRRSSDLAYALVARQQHLVAKTAATVPQPMIEDCVFLARINAHAVELQRHARTAHVQPYKVRRQQHHRPASV